MTALQQAIQDIILYLPLDYKFPCWFGHVTNIFILKGQVQKILLPQLFSELQGVPKKGLTFKFEYLLTQVVQINKLNFF